MLFEGLNLSLASGDAAMVTGPNGVGKSSLLRLIAGLLPCPSGELAVTGKVALVDERPVLDEELPLQQALHFWAKLDGHDPTSALSALGLDQLADVPVRMLSAGQRRRAGLAQVMASGADIWLLDEPGNGLDTNSLAQLSDAMAAHRAGGGIIIATSHQPLDLPNAVGVAL